MKNQIQYIAQARVEEKLFEGANALRLQENYVFGAEATTYLKEKFAHLMVQSGKFVLSNTKYHDHAYGAFSRKFMNRAIVLGCAANSYILDVGGHAIRTLVSERVVNGQKVKWTEFTHSMIPVVDYNDEIRHAGWKDMYAAMNPPAKFPHPTMCDGVATLQDGLCKCINPKTGKRYADDAVYVSIDSAYYDGVLEGILCEMDRTGNTAYIAFHDYSGAYNESRMKYKTFDDEAEIVLYDHQGEVYVKSVVRGNPMLYNHRVLATGSNGTWYIVYHDHYFVFQTIQSLKQDRDGHQNYLLVKINKITTEPIGLQRLTSIFLQSRNDEYEIPMNQMAAIPIAWRLRDFNKIDELVAIVESTLNYSKETLGLVTLVASALYNAATKRFHNTRNDKEDELIMIKKIGDEDIITVRCRLDYDDFESEFITYTVHSDKLSFAYVNMLTSFEAHMAQRVQLKIARLMWEKDSKNTSFKECADCVSLALLMISQDSLPLFKVVHQSTLVQDAKAAYRGNFRTNDFKANWCHVKAAFRKACGSAYNGINLFLKSLLSTLIYMLIGAFVVLCISFLLDRRVQAGSQLSANSEPFIPTALLVLSIAAFIRTLLGIKKKNINVCRLKPSYEPKLIYGTCVTIPDRLDLEKNLGCVNPQWCFKDKDWDIQGLKGQQAMEKLGCDRGIKEIGIQIGPILRGENEFLPVVKHACKRTMMAAAIRATSNKIQPDDALIGEWKRHFQKTITEPLIKACQAEGNIIIDLEEWLHKYPEDYREILRRDLENPRNFVHGPKYDYESFPKCEFQFFDMISDFIDTEFNTLKERQICGPSNEKKLIANAFINKLEEICDKHFPEYCGRCNWEEICHKLDVAEKKLKDPIPGFGDTSGFDMTQKKRQCASATSLVEQLFRHCSFSLPSQTPPERVVDVFRHSEVLRVSVGRGAVYYTAEGRASGDGWTTLINTLNQISYFTFVLLKAGIPSTAYSLFVKGDDVLLFLERKYVTQLDVAIQKYFARQNVAEKIGLGQIMKFKWGSTLEDGDFLSNEFFRTTHGWRMTRIPKRVLQTISFSMKTSSSDKKFVKHSQQLLFSKGHSLLAWSKDLPIFGKLARKMIQLGQEGKLTDYNQYSDSTRVWNQEYDDYEDYCDWLAVHYGITRFEIMDLEDQIDKLEDQFDTIISPALDKFYM